LGLEELVLLLSQEQLLGVEGGPELLLGKVSLSEDIMVLEELKESDSVLFDLGLDLEHQVLKSAGSLEVEFISSIVSLSSPVDVLLSNLGWVAVLQEL
jgi:hypothetical protein